MIDAEWEELAKDLKIFQTEDDGFGYKRCWMCNEEKKPLVWVLYKGHTAHLCEKCRGK